MSRHAQTLLEIKRAASVSYHVFTVNPLDPSNAYATIALAQAAAALLPTGEGVRIVLAAGQSHDVNGAITLDSRDYIIEAEAFETDGEDSMGPGTRITGAGNFTAPAVLVARTLVFTGCSCEVPLNLGSFWTLLGNKGGFTKTITRTHGAAGIKLIFEDCYFEGSMMAILNDLDAPPGAPGTNKVRFKRCKFDSFVFNDAEIPFRILGSVDFTFTDCVIEYAAAMDGVDLGIFKFNPAIASMITLENTIFNLMVMTVGTTATVFFTLGANASMFNFNDTRIIASMDCSLDMMGATGCSWDTGPTIEIFSVGAVGIVNPLIGTIIKDSYSNSVCIYDGIFWRNGEICFYDKLIPIGVAPVAEVDVGFNGAAGDWVLSASAIITSNITGAGGALKIGIGTKVAGDPDKYSLVGGLVKNTKSDATVLALARLAGAEDYGVTACDNAGVAVGTIANGAVHVRIAFIRSVTLPNVL